MQRKRRTAVEIHKSYLCPFEDCGREYGSVGALKQHMRLKHSY